MKNLKTFDEFVNERYFYGNTPEDNNPEGWKDIKTVGEVWPSLKDILSKKPEAKDFKGNSDVIKMWNGLEKWQQNFIMSKIKVKSMNDISVQTTEHWEYIYKKKDEVDGLEYLYMDANRFVSFADYPSYEHKKLGLVSPDGYGKYLTKDKKKSTDSPSDDKINSEIFPYRFKKKFIEPQMFIPNGMNKYFIILANSSNKLG